MNDQGVLLLVGAEALHLQDRLEASGYTALEWESGDGAVATAGQPPMAAIVSPGQLPQVGQLRQWFGALPMLSSVTPNRIGSAPSHWRSSAT